MLDALVVAPHPDDAELGDGRDDRPAARPGLEGRDPRPDQRRADAAGLARTPGGGDGRGQRGARRPLAEEPRPAQPEPGADPGSIAGPWPPSSAKVRPRLLFAPYWEDAHPDHIAATRLVEDARFWSKLSKSDIPGAPFHPSRILYYFSVHLRIVERPSFVLDISDQLDAKVAALRCYRSQLVDNQPAGRPGVIESVCDRTRFWGHTVGVRHAEPFASREPIGLSGIDQLLLDERKGGILKTR